MKWTKSAIILVAVIYTISTIDGYFETKKVSQKIKEEKLQDCRKEQKMNCNIIEKYHDICFDLNYKSKFKVMHFYSDRYDTCIRKQISP